MCPERVKVRVIVTCSPQLWCRAAYLVNKRQTRGAEQLAVLYTPSSRVNYSDLCERRLRSTLSFSLLADHLDADAGKGGGG